MIPYLRLKMKWPLPFTILKMFASVLSMACIMTSLPLTVFTAIAAIGIATLLPPLLKSLMTRQGWSNPHQGPVDATMRAAWVAVLGLRTSDVFVALNVTKGEGFPQAQSINSKTTLRIDIDQRLYDLPIEKFMGIALHEAGHRHIKRRQLPPLLLLLAYGAVEIALAASGLSFVSALQWASLLALVVDLPAILLSAWAGRRIEMECDVFAQLLGGDVLGGLRAYDALLRQEVGPIEPTHLPRVQGLFRSHPTLAQREAILAKVREGKLNVRAYETALLNAQFDPVFVGVSS